MIALSEAQLEVLREAVEHAVIQRRAGIENGVYRGLVARGLLMVNKYGYSITPEGYDVAKDRK